MNESGPIWQYNDDKLLSIYTNDKNNSSINRTENGYSIRRQMPQSRPHSSKSTSNAPDKLNIADCAGTNGHDDNCKRAAVKCNNDMESEWLVDECKLCTKMNYASFSTPLSLEMNSSNDDDLWKMNCNISYVGNNLNVIKSLNSKKILLKNSILIPLLLCTILILSIICSCLLITLFTVSETQRDHATICNSLNNKPPSSMMWNSTDDKTNFLLSQNPEKQKNISDYLISAFQPTNIRKNIRWLSEKMHIAGTIENQQLMKRVADQYKSYGYEVKTYDYKVLLNYPNFKKPNRIEMKTNDDWLEISNGLADPLGPIEAKQQQDDFRGRFYWVAYSKNGSVDGNIVYVNYCLPHDFLHLEKLSIVLEGKIVLCRYGALYRGDKVQLAQDRGAIGVILYSDPFDYAKDNAREKTYPYDIWLPPSGAQRGTLLKTEGDPETPFFPSKSYVYRSEKEETLRESRIMPNLPVMPIGYRDAQKIMANLNGRKIENASWKGSMNVTYRVTGTNIFRLSVNSKCVHREITNVIATIRGIQEPDRYVLLGNHVDAWVKGSIDPNSATATLLEVARVLSLAIKELKWRPRRTIMFCQWDAEEFGLIGSTEWVEEFMKLLQHRTVAMINVDNIGGNTTLSIKAVPLLYRALVDAASRIPAASSSESIAGRKTLLDSWKFYSPMNTLPGDKSVPLIASPGFGSDFQRFISYLGVPVADIKLENAPIYAYMLYHTMYETPWAIEHLIDKKFSAFTAVGRLWLELARNLADSLVIPFNVHDYALMIRKFIAKIDQELIGSNLINVIGPREYETIFYNLNDSVRRFQAQSNNLYNLIQSINTGQELISPKQLEMINTRLMEIERAFIVESGVFKNNTEYRHIVFSSNRLDEYGGVIFASVMDPIIRLKNAKSRHELSIDKRRKYIDEIRNAFNNLQYCIESAILILDIEGFYE